METMTTFLTIIVLICQPSTFTCLHDGLIAADFDMHAFKKAVVQAYNSSRSFSQNFNELVGLICPQSVYCQTNGTFETKDVNTWDFEAENISDTDDIFRNYDNIAISEARNILRRDAHNLQGCCAPCSCKEDCKERQNCCPSMDAHTADLDDLEPTNLTTQECVFANVNYYLYSESYSLSDASHASFFMVNNCASAIKNEEALTKCTNPDPSNPDETHPVYSNDVARIYKNKFCAECNSVPSATAMESLVTINHGVSLTGATRLPRSSRELYNMAISYPRYFDISYIFPRNVLNIENFGCVPERSNFFSKNAPCDSNPTLDNNQTYLFKRACKMKQYTYRVGRLLYPNVFCTLCYPFYKAGKTLCDSFGFSARDEKHSFSVILANSPSNSIVTPGGPTKDKERCSCAEIFDTSKKLCREILCPPGEMRNGCDCVPFITNLTGIRIKLHLEIRPEIPESASKKQNPVGSDLQMNVSTAITKAMKRLVISLVGPLTSHGRFLFRLKYSELKSSVYFVYIEIVTLKDRADDKGAFESMFSTLHAGLTRKIAGTQMKISLGRIFPLGTELTFNITDPSGDDTVELERVYPDTIEKQLRDLESQPLKKLLYCRRVKLDDDETQRLYNVTAAAGWSQTYLDYVYWEEDRDMCLEDFEVAFMPSNTSGARPYIYLIQRFDMLLITILVQYCNL